MSSDWISPSNLPPKSCFRALQRLLQQRERLETGGDLLRAIDDFADADNDGDTVFGEGGGGCSTFLLFLFPAVSTAGPSSFSSLRAKRSNP